ncbi:hypothetical protein FHX82_004085 [Amycolatopsis bartoniae]|uniref:GPP34 family phosphoprotein n=1 Tax=Amycolatopsis bartoniae TaxID=941986 RepID=A0A8H9IYU2_9PSEU|nr:GPP34 family phosphoprotein [Amycolatopsis bartoniae]MBB2937021.1 hypothetical protein [Amycolatopsis bartoniae]TVT06398.1 GPP34 family phosphoprotein [Amycolatopsis bartoniae]GHF51881.1 hypothetical protein GCM10017566_26420 [Amycolatopsis bartoniae]
MGESLPAKMFLLAFHPVKGRLTSRDELGHLLRAAALAELVLSGRLRDDGGKAVVAGAVPSDPVLAAVWQEVSESSPRSWSRWVGRGRKEIFAAVRDLLADERVIRVEHARWLGLVPHTRITLRDTREARRLAEQVRRALVGTQAPSRVDGEIRVLAALAGAAQLRVVLSAADRRRNRARLDQLAEPIAPVAKALRKAITAKRAAAASSG